MTGAIDPHGRHAHRHGTTTCHERTSGRCPRCSRRPATRPAIFGKWHLGDELPLSAAGARLRRDAHPRRRRRRPDPRCTGATTTSTTAYSARRPAGEVLKGYCTDVFFAQATRGSSSQGQEAVLLLAGRRTPRTARYRVRPTSGEPYASKVEARRAGEILRHDRQHRRQRRSPAAAARGTRPCRRYAADLPHGQRDGAGRRSPTGGGNDGKLVSGYNAGMRGRKGSPYEGGHRVPCFLHWPAGKLTGGRDVDGLSAHLDLLPTLIDLCGLGASPRVAFDGISLLDALTGRAPIPADRVLIAHHQELPDPERYRFASVMQGPWRLVLRNDLAGGEGPASELYHLAEDPGKTPPSGGSTRRLRRGCAVHTTPGGTTWPADSIGPPRSSSGMTGRIRPSSPVSSGTAPGNGRNRPSAAGSTGTATGRSVWPGPAGMKSRCVAGPSRSMRRSRRPSEAAERSRPTRPGSRVAHSTSVGPSRGRRAVVFTASLPAGSTRLETWFTAADGQSRGVLRDRQAR